jgi:hypothetical protein
MDQAKVRVLKPQLGKPVGKWIGNPEKLYLAPDRSVRPGSGNLKGLFANRNIVQPGDRNGDRNGDWNGDRNGDRNGDPEP